MIGVTAGCARPEPPFRVMERSASPAAAMVAAYFDALNSGDAGPVVALFADDAVVMLAGAPTATGSRAIRQLYQARSQVFGYERELHIDDIIECADVAVVRCHTTGALVMRATGQRMEAVAREVFVARDVGGRWRLTTYMNNLPTPS